MFVDSDGWSGEGEFTQVVLDRLRNVEQITALKVEDAPSTRSEADYNFIANEIFVTFAMTEREETVTRLLFFPGTKRVPVKVMTFEALIRLLEESEGIGPPDYGDEAMIQYLRTERIVPPYQTKGYKLVELVRIYESDSRKSANEIK